MRLFFHEKLNLSDNRNNRKVTIAIQLAGSLQSLGRPCPLQPFAPSTALCPLYGHVMSPLWPLPSLGPSAPSTLSVPHHATRYPLWPYIISHVPPFATATVLCPLYGSMFPLLPSATFTASVPSMAHCPLYSPLFPLRPSVLSIALYLIYSFSPLWPSVSTTFCLLYSALYPPRPSLPSRALCPLYTDCPLYPLPLQ
jgi:hypothetical protein